MLTASLGFPTEKVRTFSRARSRCLGGKRRLAVCPTLLPAPTARLRAAFTMVDMVRLLMFSMANNALHLDRRERGFE